MHGLCPSSSSEASNCVSLLHNMAAISSTELAMMVTLKTLLLTAVVLVSSIAIAYCQEHGHTHRELYVKSTPTQQCPQHHQCHTLLFYLQNGTTSFTSNTTLHFLPGNHSAAMPQPMTLVISNISNLALRGPEVGPDEPPVAHIWCNYTMQFQFTNASNVSLKGLEFRECGIKQLSVTLSCYITGSTIPSALLFESVDSIAVENVHIMYSHRFGLVVWNSFGNISVYNSNLSYNGQKNFSTDVSIGSNALFYYYTDTLPTGQTDLRIVSSTFGYGSSDDCFTWYQQSEVSGGLSVVVDSKASLSDTFITIAVSESIFHNNRAGDGANMKVLVRSNSTWLPHVYLSILNSSFINGTALEYGGGLYLDSLYRSTICKSIFLGNSAKRNGGGLYLRDNDISSITGSTFLRNLAGRFGGGLFIASYYFLLKQKYNISNTTFLMNRAEQDGGGAYIDGAIVGKLFTLLYYTIFTWVAPKRNRNPLDKLRLSKVFVSWGYPSPLTCNFFFGDGNSSRFALE